MVQRNRPSQVKYEREQRKRERKQRKAEKAAQKRERRFGQEDADAESLDDDQSVVPDLPTEDMAPLQEP
jgi:hypothetical protein